MRNFFPPHPPPSSFEQNTHQLLFGRDLYLIRGVSHTGGCCKLPVSRCWAKKAGPSPARKKNPFFLGSHADQLARVSPLLETLRLRPQTLNTEMLLDRYENRAGWEGEGRRQRSLEPSGSSLSWNVSPLLAPFPGGHPPLPRKWQVSFH